MSFSSTPFAFIDLIIASIDAAACDRAPRRPCRRAWRRRAGCCATSGLPVALPSPLTVMPVCCCWPALATRVVVSPHVDATEQGDAADHDACDGNSHSRSHHLDAPLSRSATTDRHGARCQCYGGDHCFYDVQRRPIVPRAAVLIVLRRALRMQVPFRPSRGVPLSRTAPWRAGRRGRARVDTAPHLPVRVAGRLAHAAPLPRRGVAQRRLNRLVCRGRRPIPAPSGRTPVQAEMRSERTATSGSRWCCSTTPPRSRAQPRPPPQTSGRPRR